MFAEVVKHYIPKLVDLHNYISAHSIAQKLYNWETLNRTTYNNTMCIEKVFKKLGIQVRKTDVEQIVNGVPEIVERVLKLLQIKATT